MTHDSLKFLNQNILNLHVALIEEFLDTATDEEYTKIPTFLLTKEEQDVIHRQASVFCPSRDYVPGDSPLKYVYSMGGMPFRIKIRETKPPQRVVEGL